MHDLGIYIAIRAINEYANSALPNAPIRPDPAKRRTLRRLIHAAKRLHQGIGASTSPGRTVGRTPAVRRQADKPAPGDWPGRAWQATPATQPVEGGGHPSTTASADSSIELVS